ncbi:MAG TPA: hypothetical protein VHO02_02560, partial [Fibrobacteria bacterium]|nr:hypothetical protein [Fibrobacteria bacterium]
MTRPALPHDPEPTLPFAASSRVLVLAIAAAVAILGFLSLIGLAAGYRPLVFVATGGGPLAPLAALGLIAGAGTLWLRSKSAPEASGGSARASLAHILTALLIIGGLAVFVLRLVHVLPSPHGQLPTLSLGFALLGLAFALSGLRAKGRRIWLQVPIFPVFWLSLLVVLARLYGIRNVSTYFELILFPVQTAPPLCALATGILLLHPREGVAGIITSRFSGGV